MLFVVIMAVSSVLWDVHRWVLATDDRAKLDHVPNEKSPLLILLPLLSLLLLVSSALLRWLLWLLLCQLSRCRLVQFVYKFVLCLVYFVCVGYFLLFLIILLLRCGCCMGLFLSVKVAGVWVLFSSVVVAGVYEKASQQGRYIRMVNEYSK